MPVVATEAAEAMCQLFAEGPAFPYDEAPLL